MGNEFQQPLQFFEDLLVKNNIDFLKDCFINNFIETHRRVIISIDYLKGIIKYTGCVDDGSGIDCMEVVCTTSFDVDFINKIKSHELSVKNYIDKTIIEITQTGKNPSEFISLQINILDRLENKAQKIYPDFPAIRNSIVSLQNHIVEKYGFVKPLTSHIEHPEDYSAKSFLWDAIDDESRKETLSKLYDLLSAHPKIIDCSKEELINAFSQKVVPNGIKWCVKGKSGQISKASLIYFVEQLNSNFIEEISDNEFNKKIEYVFRNDNNDFLKNIRQSKNKVSKAPASKERIDEILKKIFT